MYHIQKNIHDYLFFLYNWYIILKENLAIKGWLIKGKQEYAKATRIGARIAKCVQIMLPNEEEIEEEAPTILPF